MKIINELARAQTQNRENSLAIRCSVLIAVIMIGTLLFIYSELELGQWKYHQELFGDFHAQLYGISESEYERLQSNVTIETLELSQGIVIEAFGFQRPKVDMYFQTPALLNTSFFSEVRSLQGRLPQEANEILVSDAFILENQDYSIGSLINLGIHTYKISGIYKEQLYSFEKNYRFFGLLSFDDANELFQADRSVDATIWFHNERDTYTNMRYTLQELGRESEPELLKKGGLAYNTTYLEGKLIFQGGLIPSSDFIERWSFRVGILAVMGTLFIVMIYNAFNVWNNQDLRQIGLLKSSGMTQRQIHELVIKKALYLSLRPILLGLVMAYGAANLLFYLMWLNEINAHVGRTTQFRLVTPNPMVSVILFILALVCVLLAALKPARQSAKLSVIEALQRNHRQTSKSSKRLSTLRPYTNTARNLAKDNSLSYKHIFRSLALAMALAGMAFSSVLIIQSQRSLEEQYNVPDSPYTLTSLLLTIQAVPRSLFTEIKAVPNIQTSHIYTSYDFKYLPAENQGFISDELQAIHHEQANNAVYRPTVTVFGLDDNDFTMLINQLGLTSEKDSGFILLDRIAQNPYQAYKHRTYIPLSQSTASTIAVQDYYDNEKYNLPIMGRVTSFPFELNPLWPDQIALFTSMSKLEDFRIHRNNITESRTLTYRIKVAADLVILPQVTSDVQTIIHSYIPKTDTITHNWLSNLASQKEQKRNELLLAGGSYILLIIIGISNAYNSFHANLKARTRDFALLRSVGMTEDQLASMLNYEGLFLIRKVGVYYVLLLSMGVFAMAYKKKFMFSPWQLVANLNFPLLSLFFLFTILGIWTAIASGKRKVLDQSITLALHHH